MVADGAKLMQLAAAVSARKQRPLLRLPAMEALLKWGTGRSKARGVKWKLLILQDGRVWPLDAWPARARAGSAYHWVWVRLTISPPIDGFIGIDNKYRPISTPIHFGGAYALKLEGFFGSSTFSMVFLLR